MRYSGDLGDALKDADMVLEAVPEKLETQARGLAQLEGLVAPDTIIASNTSGIPITRIAEGLQHPERVLGMHWSNPPHLIPMIEVIPGEQHRRRRGRRCDGQGRSGFGYEAVVEQEVPGFVENRILYAILREACPLVDRGIVEADMDTCVRGGSATSWR